MTSATVRKLIARCRKLFASPECEKDPRSAVDQIAWKLRNSGTLLLVNRGLLGEFMELIESTSLYRGPGCQIAASEFSSTLGWLVRSLDRILPGDAGDGWVSLDEARRQLPEPKSQILLDALEVLQAQALKLVQGPPSRSRHTSLLKAEAWERLARCWHLIHDPEIVRLAVKTATDHRAGLPERNVAIDFLSQTGTEDGAPPEVADALESVVDDPPDRDTLVSALQAQIELGLDDKLGALFAVEHWDDAHGDS